MNHTFLLIGSNLGDRRTHLKTARFLIQQQAGVIKKQSAIYETEPWGGITQQPHYYNQVFEVLTELDAESLMKVLLGIEEKMGRVRNEKYGSRMIDIDILFYNYEIINSPLVVVPHPRLQDRRFVLEPLFSIAPEWMHPVLNKPVAELLAGCADTNKVKKI